MVRFRVRFLFFILNSPLLTRHNMLQALLRRKKYEKAMSDEQPQYANTFCNITNNSKLQSTPDTPNFWSTNKISHNNLCAYTFMHHHISSLISASLPIIT